jgi:gas vesicle protein
MSSNKQNENQSQETTFPEKIKDTVVGIGQGIAEVATEIKDYISDKISGAKEDVEEVKEDVEEKGSELKNKGEKKMGGGERECTRDWKRFEK